MEQQTQQDGASLPPNILWLRKHTGKTVEIDFGDETFQIAVESNE
jgi:hypothetical protein